MVGFRLVALMSLLLWAAACSSDAGDPLPDEPDAGLAGDGDGDGDGDAPTFMEPCDIANDSCQEPYFCFDYNMRGPHCTKECTLDEQCEAPSRGCNMMGVCKSP